MLTRMRATQSRCAVKMPIHYFYTTFVSPLLTLSLCCIFVQDMAEDEVKPMIVSQFHFTGWPDHGAPDTGCEFPALSFILKSATASRDGAGPVIVHCRCDSRGD